MAYIFITGPVKTFGPFSWCDFPMYFGYLGRSKFVQYRGERPEWEQQALICCDYDVYWEGQRDPSEEILNDPTVMLEGSIIDARRAMEAAHLAMDLAERSLVVAKDAVEQAEQGSGSGGLALAIEQADSAGHSATQAIQDS